MVLISLCCFHMIISRVKSELPSSMPLEALEDAGGVLSGAIGCGNIQCLAEVMPAGVWLVG